jgi:hypothetical protein
MPAVTVELAPDLVAALTESAERNRRSLDAEIAWRLDNSVIRPARRLTVEEIQERADRFHEKLRRDGFVPPTDEEITRYKNQGRL